MIHNNLRKIIRRFAFVGSGTSDTRLVGYDYTDYTGYTGSDPTNDSVIQGYLSASSGCLSSILATPTGVATISSIWGSSSSYAVPQLGTTSALEPDYTLGTIVSNDCSYSLSASYITEPIITATVINTTNNDITFNEVGLFMHIRSSNSSSYYWNGETNNYTQRNFLLIKEILPQSMTLEAQSSVSFAFNILGNVTT